MTYTSFRMSALPFCVLTLCILDATSDWIQTVKFFMHFIVFLNAKNTCMHMYVHTNIRIKYMHTYVHTKLGNLKFDYERENIRGNILVLCFFLVACCSFMFSLAMVIKINSGISDDFSVPGKNNTKKGDCCE